MVGAVQGDRIRVAVQNGVGAARTGEQFLDRAVDFLAPAGGVAGVVDQGDGLRQVVAALGERDRRCIEQIVVADAAAGDFDAVERGGICRALG
jgi:hypothetical protein